MMDVQFYGANCVSMNFGNARVVIDDTLAPMGGKAVTKPGDIVLFTAQSDVAPRSAVKDAKLVVDMPGEYEVSDVSIYGIQARGHMDEDKQKRAVMYKLIAKDLRVLVCGHVFPKFSETLLEQIGMVDVMIVPVGGGGYTVDPIGAVQLIKEVEPKLVIPTYYADSSLKFEVPPQSLDQALQGLGMEPKERTSKLKLKHADLPETAQLVVVEKS